MIGHINRVIDMGFLRRLDGRDEQFEVRRVLKAFVDAQWLNEFEQRLATYRQHLSGADVAKEEVVMNVARQNPAAPMQCNATGNRLPSRLSRLDRLEVYNWGTFHNRVWALRPSS